MASGDVLVTYGTSAAVTITIASLATSSTKLVGRESTLIDNTTLKADDYLVSGKITTGTSPTTGKSIELFCIPWDKTQWPWGFTGADAAGPTIIAENKAQFRPIYSTATVATSNQAYEFGLTSVKSLFGYTPPKFNFFLTHDTGVNLNSTGGNHWIYVLPVFYNVSP